MKTGAIIQARTTSTRLPNKILKDLPYGCGTTVLQQVIKRLKRSNAVNEIIIATTSDDADDSVVSIAGTERVSCFRGSRENVLERFYLSAKEHNLDVIARITSDCPCIDPGIVDSAINKHIETQADYTSNIQTRTFPHGLDIEVISFSAIEKAYKKATEDFEREHVTPYIHRTAPDSFNISAINAPEELYAPNIRITLDTEEDYILLCAVFDHLYGEDNYFGLKKIVKLFQKKPWLHLINKKILQKKIFDTLEEELEEAKKILDMQDLKKAREFICRQLTRKP